MFRRFAPMLMVLAAFILDTTVLPIVYGGVFTVPLTLVAVLLTGMLKGRMSGLLYGTIGGLLIDITSGTLGLMTFFFMGVGFLVGLILYNPGEYLRSARRVRRRRWLQRGLCVFALYAVGEIALFVIQYFNTADLRPVFFVNIGARSLICVALTLALFAPARAVMLDDDRHRAPSRDREVKTF